ncbi:MAG: hypothetical protein RBR19_17765 [Sedimentisphaerales bacterium]|nr:hypothetical protein [Sedimentisphaerales bacterium]
MTSSGDREKRRHHGEGEDNWWNDLFIAIRNYIGLKLLIAIIVLSSTGLLLVIFSHKKAGQSTTYYIMREIGKAVCITALASGGVKWYMTRQASVLDRLANRRSEQQLSADLEELRGQVVSQTGTICRSASSLVAMHQADIVHFYKNRMEASTEIKTALEDTHVTEIKIIGISLNDFTRDEQRELQQAWKTIETYVSTGQPPKEADRLDVKVLLIDPMSEGALLRSKAEGCEDRVSRLQEDVGIAISDLYALERQSKNEKVTFEAKVYRTAPILYLVWTPCTAFVQQYYFRPRHRDVNVSIPVAQYSNKPCCDTHPHSIHEELRFHFDWIWDNASVSLKKYVDEHCMGIGAAVNEAGITNIYYDSDLSRQRILHLIRQPDNKRLWIKGISLRSFFRWGDLFDALTTVARRPDIDLRILLINPDSEQANMRSFREFAMTGSPMTFDGFDDDARRDQRLYKDTVESINQVRGFLQECRQREEKVEMRVKLFRSATEAFLLITDDSVLVEQYHYGKIGPGLDGETSRKILGGDVPLIEYSRREKSGDNILKDPYRIFSDHFEFVFDHYAASIDTWSTQDRNGPTGMPNRRNSSARKTGYRSTSRTNSRRSTRPTNGKADEQE